MKRAAALLAAARAAAWALLFGGWLVLGAWPHRSTAPAARPTGRASSSAST